MKIDLAIVARDLKLPPEKIETTVELLDAGNTIPFITRFRKDLTGGLNEEQILAIKQRVAQLRALAERKAFVLKSIESQGKLTDELKIQIGKSSTSRRLEDLYLPFKPRKQSRASLARQQGLEPLADDIFQATSPDVEIATRATEFVRVDKGLTSVDDVIKGVGDLLAERFSEHDELRSTLRRIMWTDGKLTAQSIAPPPEAAEAGTADAASATPSPTAAQEKAPAQMNIKFADSPSETDDTKVQQAKLSKATGDPATPALKQVAQTGTAGNPDGRSDVGAATDKPESVVVTSAEAAVDSASKPEEVVPAKTDSTDSTEAASAEATPTEPVSVGQTPVEATPAEATPAEATPAEAAPAKAASTETTPADSSPNEVTSSSTADQATSSIATGSVSTDSAPAKVEPAKTPVPAQATKTKKKKKKKKKPVEDPFKDYKDFKQPLKQVPNHRVLAINRGERAGSLKVKISVEGDKLAEAANTALVPETHPFREFLQKCAHDALNRMVVPSLEREIRRELTETAEKHAVEVFANNLRNLLLQPPIRNRTVLAIDPGFKRGCSVAVLDSCGNLLDSGHVFVVGNQSRRDESREKIAAWVKKHNADVIAIGNGAACRQTEQMVSDTIAEQLKDLETTYVMVNEAGASIYSTSEIGRTELPDVSPSIRSAVSIGRRLQDPLSELVKISPANIGVGMYQHDVKAKHLSESLDEVVRFCVNRVGVDVNMASPSLLKYVSGLNSLTARRVVEHRQANGQFKNRNQLKDVSGFGEATFVQSAGFLRVHGGDAPLDCTSIHPESYEIANDVMKRIDVSVEEFFPKELVSVATKPEVPSSAPTEVPSTSPTEVASTIEVSSTESKIEATAETPAVEAPSSEAPSSEAPSSEAPPVETPPVVDVGVSASSAESKQGSESESAATQESIEKPPETAGAETASTPVPSDGASKPAKSKERVQDSIKRKEILKKMSDLDVDELAQQHSAGKLLVKDILMALKRPKWDPRDKINKPIFRRGIIKADDLKPNMQIDGQVVNVVDFGVFVDIGLGESSLVHVSQLSNHFIRDPHRFYSVGDVLKVWVSEIDTQRRRVKLTAVRPGSKKPSGRRPRQTERSGSASASSSGSGTPARSGQTQSTGRAPYKPGKYGGSKGKPSNRSGQRTSYGKGAPAPKSHTRRSKPKDVKPITDKMLKGKEPMRSFSDLAQFVSKKPKDVKEEKTDKDSSS